jgi:uncharacterized protein (DUF1330 family)
MANIRIKDQEEYQKYLASAGEVFSKYNGVYLAVDDQPEVLEGNWDYTRAVLIRFDHPEDFHAWYRSEAYQEILQHRLLASECDTILMHGKQDIN